MSSGIKHYIECNVIDREIWDHLDILDALQEETEEGGSEFVRIKEIKENIRVLARNVFKSENIVIRNETIT